MQEKNPSIQLMNFIGGPSDREREEHLQSQACQASKEGFKLKMRGEGNLNPSHCYQFDAGPGSKGPEPGAGSQVGRRAPERQHNRTPASKSASLGAQLKCLYASTCSMGNKQEELETCAHLQGYDLIGIRDMVGWLL